MVAAPAGRTRSLDLHAGERYALIDPQVKDVVAYARKRYVTIVPEIELPGHSTAALAAYPGRGALDAARVRESERARSRP